MTEAAWSHSSLLIVSGLSPQVITETLFALHREDRWPSKLHVFTTPQGQKALEQQLLGPQGQLAQLAKDYHRPALSLPEAQIHVGTDLLGSSAHTEQHLDTVDQLLKLVSSLTAEQCGPLAFSLAGGRKTMSFFAGYIFSLLARPEDRLLHVTVNAEFENVRDFYYPTPEPRWISGKDPSQPLDCQKAQILLTELPVVKLREGLPKDLIQGQLSYTDTIARAQKANHPPQAKLCLTQNTLHCSGTAIVLKPSLLALYAWLLQKQQTGDQLHWYQDNDEQRYAKEYLSTHKQLFSTKNRHEQLAKTLAAGLNNEWFLKKRAQLNNVLTQTLGAQLARPYLIQSSGKNHHKHYHLGLEPEAIVINHTAEPSVHDNRSSVSAFKPPRNR